MDGTLYYQLPLRFCMGIELMFFYIIHICRVRELFMLRRFRKSYESGVLQAEPPIIQYWMQEKPSRYIALFKDRKLLRLIRRLRENGAKIAVYSDYPVRQKIKALPELEIDFCFCSADAVIQCLKPDPKGLKNILNLAGETAENSLFIGDRYEKDGKCAENSGIDFIILDGNPLLRNFKFYREEINCAGNY
jgi:HAD superfamily hydrolase (TIGR01549 family)